MTARLIQLKNGQRIAQLELRSEPVQIGRDPSAEFPLEERHGLISRRHALIVQSGRRHMLQDLSSQNGTWLNGTQLVGEAELRPGDQIDLARQVLLYYEVDSRAASRPKLIAIFAVLIAVLLSGAWYAIDQSAQRDSSGSETLQTLGPAKEACDLTIDAVAAQENAKPKQAVQLFRRSVRLLYDAGVLDDIKRQEEALMKGGLTFCGKQMGMDLIPIFEIALSDTAPKQTAVSVTCSLDRIQTKSEFDGCLRKWVEHIFFELRQDPTYIPEWFYDQVGTTLAKERHGIRAAKERGRAYVPTIKRELEKRHMPALLHYLASIESGYNEIIGSHAGAKGMWQFMPSTAQRFGLTVKGRVDQRNDWEKATVAAAEYLRDLAFDFGGNALLLSLAGYNRGEAGVRRSFRKLENPFEDRSYWRLSEGNLLPKETRDYVPRFVAHAVAGEGGLPDSETLARAGYQ